MCRQVRCESDVAVYGYDSAGRRTSLLLPNGVLTEYVYDSQDRLTGEERKNATGELVYNERFVYDAVESRTRQVK